jgi:hypothetical protein
MSSLVTEKQLLIYFSQYGRVKSVKLQVDSATGEGLGIARVVYVDEWPSGAVNAVKSSKHEAYPTIVLDEFGCKLKEMLQQVKKRQQLQQQQKERSKSVDKTVKEIPKEPVQEPERQLPHFPRDWIHKGKHHALEQLKQAVITDIRIKLIGSLVYSFLSDNLQQQPAPSRITQALPEDDVEDGLQKIRLPSFKKRHQPTVPPPPKQKQDRRRLPVHEPQDDMDEMTRLLAMAHLHLDLDDTHPPPSTIDSCSRTSGLSKAPKQPPNTINVTTITTQPPKRKSARRSNLETLHLDSYHSINQLQSRKKALVFDRSPIQGFGLYAQQYIAPHDMIIEYVGELIRQRVADHRERMYWKQGIGASYLFRIDDDTVIDATRYGNIARFLNHCCVPNCIAKIITLDGKKRIVLYAKQEILPGEELTYDYKFPIEEDKIVCNCGASGCRKYLN